MFMLTSTKRDNRYILYHEDGLMDIFVGLGIAFAGLFIWTGIVWMAGIFIPVFLPSFQAARKKFLQPRIGFLVHNPQQLAQAQKVLFSITLWLGVLFLVGIGMFVVFDFIPGAVNAGLREYFLLVLGSIFSAMWIFAGRILKISRFYLYATFTFFALSVAQFTVIPFELALTVIGGLIILVGLLFLIRFLRQHPVFE